MNNSKSYLLLLLGEILLVVTFLYFGKNLTKDVLFLDITISSIIYLLIFSSFLTPLLDLKDKSQSRVGSLGVSWFFSSGYAIIAILLMYYFSKHKEYEFETQLLFQSILVFFLLIGAFISNRTNEKVAEVYFEQKKERDKVNDIQKATKRLASRIELMTNISPEIKYRVNKMVEELRFVSPTNNSDSYEIEMMYLSLLDKLDLMLINFESNKENIDLTIKQCDQLIKERKQVYSN
jgi:hypothetical protein